MELSQDGYKILKPNSIHIGGVSFTKRSSSSQRNMISEFHSIQIGSNIQATKVGILTTLNMDRIKRKKILITINKSECHTSSSNVQILNTRLDLRNNKKNNSDYVGAGIVVLMMGIKNTKKQNSLDDKRVVWSRLIIEMCEYCKNNILDSNMVNHHGSSGKLYSFGYQGVFKQIKNSSVGLYEVRKRFEDERQEDVEHTARIIEEKIAFEMSVASKTLSNVVEYADKLFLPTLDIASKMQSTYGNISLNKDKEQCSSMWNTHVCINASTQEFHTEKNTSYTLITVPAQDSKAQNVCCNMTGR